jgi:hypothetical protein
MSIGNVGRPTGLPKTGGRKKGTPNKATLTIAERFEDLGWDPLAGLAEIVKDPKNTPELRARCHWEAMAYLYPKRKAIDSAVDRPTSMNMITNLDTSPVGHNVGDEPSLKS